jgi:hypothetical protein
MWLRSPTALQSELGLQARRAGLKLTEPQYQQAAERVLQQGELPADAVRAVAPPPKLKASAAEIVRYRDLLARGMSQSAALEQIRTERDLAARLGTPTAAAVRESVAERNVTGRWPDQ